VYGAIAFIWIVIPVTQTIHSALIMDIVDGSCTRYAINNSYALMKGTGFFTIVLSYLLPLSLMVFCYTRVVTELRSKVAFSYISIFFDQLNPHYQLIYTTSISEHGADSKQMHYMYTIFRISQLLRKQIRKAALVWYRVKR